MTKIQTTKDYDKFSSLKSCRNRDVNDHLVLRLVESIQAHDKTAVNPIIVTPKMEVIDGQHRLEACKRLELPVYYIVDKDFEDKDLITINNNRNCWNVNDYIAYYQAQGNNEYRKLADFMRMYDMSLSASIPWVAATPNDKKRSVIKDGNFHFDLTPEEDKALEYVFEYYDMLLQARVPKKLYRQDAYLSSALHELLLHPFVDGKEFIYKALHYPHKFVKRPTIADYLSDLLDIYNYKRTTRRLVMSRSGPKFHISRLSTLG